MNFQLFGWEEEIICWWTIDPDPILDLIIKIIKT